MIGELLTLPLRVSMRAAQMTVRAGLTLSERALTLASGAARRF